MFYPMHQQAGRLHLLPPYLTFASLDRKSVRFTLPLCTVRRVERLNTRTGVFALSLLVWHGMKIVSLLIIPLLLLVKSTIMMLTTPYAFLCARNIDRTTYCPPPDRRSILCAPPRRATCTTATGADEGNEVLRAYLLLRGAPRCCAWRG